MSLEEAMAMRKTAKHLEKRPADLNWMLDIIATIVPNHEYFEKNYRKPKKIVDEGEIQPGLVSNHDGFFNSLPISKNAHKKHKLNLAGQTKVERERAKLIKMQKQAQKI